MNKRDAAIVAWVDDHRPELTPSIQQSFENQGLRLLLSIGFEAGRRFQQENSEAELDNPNIYL